jgi:uncharacterized membrane protein
VNTSIAPHLALELVLVLLACGVALGLRPWRAVGRDGPPWPWLAWAAVLPLLWGADHYLKTPLALPLSGACLLMLMAGWPLAVLALIPVAALTAFMAEMPPGEMLHRLVWLGLMPVTAAMLLGAALRRWLPNHLFVYILGRGFFATALAVTAAGWLGLWRHGQAIEGVGVGDAAIAVWLTAWGDAFITGMIVSIFVAFRPQWLATYADRIYLPVTRPSDGV